MPKTVWITYTKCALDGDYWDLGVFETEAQAKEAAVDYYRDIHVQLEQMGVKLDISAEDFVKPEFNYWWVRELPIGVNSGLIYKDAG